MKLDPLDYTQLRNALVDGFDTSSLTLVLRLTDHQLEHVAASTVRFPEVVHQVIQSAERGDWIDALISSAKQTNPTNKLVAGLPDSMAATTPTQPAATASVADVDPDSPYPSVFISYSSKDDEFAGQLYEDLRQNNVPVWFAPEDLRIGDKTRVALSEAVIQQSKFLLIVSEHSVASDWVEQEIETAFEWERDHKPHLKVFPVRLDDAIFDHKVGWPSYLKNTRNIGDFRNWNNDSAYQRSLRRILRDLKL